MMNVVFFFGANNKNGEFSNNFVRQFEVFGHKYCCVEQYKMAQKALIFRDIAMFNKIMSSRNPVEMKHLGREVKNFSASRWGAVKEKVVRRAVMAKFSQNEDLKEMLLATGERLIAEANPKDRVWGIGMYKSAKDVMERMDEWGENKMGKILMEVRDALRDKGVA